MRTHSTLTAVLLLAAVVPAQRFTPGNVLVSSADFLWELDQSRQVVRQVGIPTATTSGRLEPVDLVVDSLGTAHVLLVNAFGPGALASYDPVAGTWDSHPVAGALGNVSDGDLSIAGSFIYTRISRIELPSFTVVDLPTRLGASEVSAGLDGRLLKVDGGLPRRFIRELDPVTFQEIATIQPQGPSDIRGVTSLPNGELVIADWNGTLYRCSADGQTLLASLNAGVGSLVDVDANPDGRLVATGRFGDVVFTDAALTSVRTANPAGGFSDGWACFVPDLGPNLDAIVPASGSWRGPATVEIRGRFFASSTIRGVSFGGQPATGVTVASDNLIRCTPPAGLPGPVDVVVDSDSGPVTLSGGFVYTPGLVAATTVAPGSTLQLGFQLERPGDFVVALLGNSAAAPTQLAGIDRDLWIGDPTVLFVAPFWPGASLPLMLRVPADLGLLGVAATFQAASGVPGRATWTNAVTVRVAD